MNKQPLNDWFDAALARPKNERLNWLLQECADEALRQRVIELLAADARQDADVLDTPVLELASRIAVEAPNLDAGQFIGMRVGAFRLQRLIGQGGMAAVFLAERVDADFAQRVAVKLLQRGLFSALEQKLFRRERQALALLSHPNIAQIIDGGVTDSGVAYLAMEYVDGVALTQYCSDRELGLEHRLLLFATVCRAVEAAHRALIVHRDIKPANILVSNDGSVKLLDFGIAKLLEGDVEPLPQTHLAPLTPEYAAPEQFDGGAITTATDVYALGVLLHELLTGTRPQRGTRRPSSQCVELDNVETIAFPTSPQVLRRLLKGDLDNIIGKAIETEPERRYANAGAFADDIERHLRGLPVHAHPPSGWYRTRKFVQRHRGRVAMTVLLVIGVLVSLLVALWQADVARKEAARANMVRDFLVGALDAGRVHVPREQRPTLSDLIAAARVKIDADLQLDVETRAEILRTLAEVSWSTADSDMARALFERAISEREKVSGREDPEVVMMRARLAELFVDTGEIGAAQQVIDEIAEMAFHRVDATAVEIGIARAMVRQRDGQGELAVSDLPRLLRLAESVFAGDVRSALETRLSIGGIYSSARANMEAVRLLKPSLAEWRSRGFPENAFVAISMSNLTTVLRGVGDAADSIRIGRESLTLHRRIFDADHPEIAFAMANLAANLAIDGQIDEALALHRNALEMRRAVFGPDSVELLSSLSGLAHIERVQRNFDAALAYLHDAERICRIGDHLRQPNCTRILHNVAYVNYQMGRDADAERFAQETLRVAQQTGGDGHPDVASAWSLLATVASGALAFERSLERIDKALELMHANPDTGQESLQLARLQRVETFIGLNRCAEALTEVESILPAWTAITSPSHFRLVSILEFRMRAQLCLGDAAAAGASARAALALGVDERLIKAETLLFLKATATVPSPAH